MISDLKRRTRMVNFRLSEDEYENLKKVCITNGARSLSEFAREAVRERVSDGGESADKVKSTVRDLTGEMRRLDREVKRLASLLEPPGSPAPSNISHRILPKSS